MGILPPLLHRHVHNRTLEHPRRGIYRLANFPPADHEELIVLWLWSKQQAVFSHETALELHELSDAFPASIHLTLPTSASRRRMYPPGAIVHYADIPDADRQWLGPVPLTTPARTVLDIVNAHGDPLLIIQAIDQGIRAGLFSIEHVAPAGRYIADALEA
jgi:predicted transcriptional regulator of viral defense system